MHDLTSMNIIQKYIEYLKDNPKGYWFKRKVFGWGWIPVRWQGWFVILVALAVAVTGGYITEIDDAPGALLLGILLALAIIFGFGYWKGEKPKWSWGFPEDKI